MGMKVSVCLHTVYMYVSTCVHFCVYLCMATCTLCVCSCMCTLACILRHTPCNHNPLASGNFPGLAYEKLGSKPSRETERPLLFLSFAAWHQTPSLFPPWCVLALLSSLCRICLSGSPTNPGCLPCPSVGRFRQDGQ